MRRHRVEHPVDAFAARRSAMELAGELGFHRLACLEIAIATSELAVNIAKYGVRGEVTVEAIDDPCSGPGVVIVACDAGPPFHDFELASATAATTRARSAALDRRRHGLGRGSAPSSASPTSWAGSPPRGQAGPRRPVLRRRRAARGS